MKTAGVTCGSGPLAGLTGLTAKASLSPAIAKKQGLASDLISGILEDGQGNLWLSTGSGLTKFDPRNETFRELR